MPWPLMEGSGFVFGKSSTGLRGHVFNGTRKVYGCGVFMV